MYPWFRDPAVFRTFWYGHMVGWGVKFGLCGAAPMGIFLLIRTAIANNAALLEIDQEPETLAGTSSDSD